MGFTHGIERFTPFRGWCNDKMISSGKLSKNPVRMADLTAPGFNPEISEKDVDGVLAVQTGNSSEPLPPKPLPDWYSVLFRNHNLIPREDSDKFRSVINSVKLRKGRD